MNEFSFKFWLSSLFEHLCLYIYVHSLEVCAILNHNEFMAQPKPEPHLNFTQMETETNLC